MKHLTVLVILLVCVSSSLAAEVAALADGKKLRCPVCGMFVAPYADWNATITFTDAPAAVFDGSKDMFKYHLDMKKYAPSRSRDSISSIMVKDYFSKQDTDALKAYYVIWGDVYGPMGHEPIPFQNESDARKFLIEHHGKKVLRFNDITLKLLHSLDNPE